MSKKKFLVFAGLLLNLNFCEFTPFIKKFILLSGILGIQVFSSGITLAFPILEQYNTIAPNAK
jgi:hypothetical protein